jgi:hypothetical protein
MDLREIPQLMESYPQLIPRIAKVVEPLKSYIKRHYHGERGENITKKYCHFDRGYFEQGVGQGGLGEVAASASTDCKHLVMFSLIYMLGMFPSSLCIFSWACLFLINLV